MIRVTKAKVLNLESAARGARNPLASWERSDSTGTGDAFRLGEADLGLLARLSKAGSDHRKFNRMILLCCDVEAPLYWWKEYDTYKVGTVANSTSTMHKIHAKPFSRADFSCDRMNETGLAALDRVIDTLEGLRLGFVETGDRELWYTMIQLLPSSYNQLRTCTLNYENLINIYRARKNHKLDEWREFFRFIEGLPYAKELITF